MRLWLEVAGAMLEEVVGDALPAEDGDASAIERFLSGFIIGRNEWKNGRVGRQMKECGGIRYSGITNSRR